MSDHASFLLCRRTALLVAGNLPFTLRPARGDELLDLLRAGGLAILMRHSQTVSGTGDPPGYRLDDCATQRNLSDAGRAQARRTGERLREEHVPFDKVLTSAWCRCRETAELLGLGPVEHLRALDSFFDDRGRRAWHREGMLRFIAGWRGPGNVVLVTHQVNVTAVSGTFAASGEIVVMTAGATAETVGRLRL